MNLNMAAAILDEISTELGAVRTESAVLALRACADTFGTGGPAVMTFTGEEVAIMLRAVADAVTVTPAA